MTTFLSRRSFLAASVQGSALAALSGASPVTSRLLANPASPDFPVVDFHAHVDPPLTIEQALKLAHERSAKLGVPEHGGRDQVIHDDATLQHFLDQLAPYPVYKGIQAEGLDWPGCFSKPMVAKLDYVLSDALTFPDRDGKLLRLWMPEAQFTDGQDFMERYVAFNVRVISEEPIDILGNPTFLPDIFVKRYDELWTKPRMETVIEAAAANRVAIEINSRYNIPSLAFLKLAKKAGVKFSFGSNNHDDSVGKLEYSLRMAKELGLTRKDMFSPAPPDRKPILWRKMPA